MLCSHEVAVHYNWSGPEVPTGPHVGPHRVPQLWGLGRRWCRSCQSWVEWDSDSDMTSPMKMLFNGKRNHRNCALKVGFEINHIALKKNYKVGFLLVVFGGFSFTNSSPALPTINPILFYVLKKKHINHNLPPLGVPHCTSMWGVSGRSSPLGQWQILGMFLDDAIDLGPAMLSTTVLITKTHPFLWEANEKHSKRWKSMTGWWFNGKDDIP